RRNSAHAGSRHGTARRGEACLASRMPSDNHSFLSTRRSSSARRIERGSGEWVDAGAEAAAVGQKQNVRGAGCAVVSADDQATGLDRLSPRAAELMDQLRLSRRTEGHEREPTHAYD